MYAILLIILIYVDVILMKFNLTAKYCNRFFFCACFQLFSLSGILIHDMLIITWSQTEMYTLDFLNFNAAV